jgi:predicted DNA-binding antitoxin AbrB/MazE fold protein
MTVINIEAIYQNGVFKPAVKLDLPENTPVALTLTPLPVNSADKGRMPFASLRGIWANVQFPDSTEDMLQQVRQQSTEKMARLAAELADGR